jgi:hypothetical protein
MSRCGNLFPFGGRRSDCEGHRPAGKRLSGGQDHEGRHLVHLGAREATNQGHLEGPGRQRLKAEGERREGQTTCCLERRGDKRAANFDSRFHRP